VVQEDHPTPQNWKFFTEETTQTIQVPSRLAVNLGEPAVSAATVGAGIACTLSYLVDDLVKSGSLVKLLGAYESPPTPVSLIYPSRRQVPRKLRAFLDFSVPRLRQRLGDNDT
jgi:DNA-binding transcriptional LysR family regulator